MMADDKSEQEMTVAELARITGLSFSSLETGLEKRFDAIDNQFRDMRNEMIGFAEKSDLREFESRLLTVLNRIESKLPDFDVMKADIADLSGRVTIRPIPEKKR